MKKTLETFAGSPSRVDAGTKTRYLVALALLVSAPYFWLERHIFFPVTQVRAGTVDEWLPLVPIAAWIYVSLYLQLALPLVLVRDRQRLRHKVFGFAWIAVISHLVFFFWPTMVPAFPATASNLPLRFILAVDTPGNALPSMHASLAVYCAFCSVAIFKRRWPRVAIWAWTALILASTLLAKRHMLIDVAAGAALGTFAYWALFHRPSEEPQHCDAWQNTVQARKALSQEVEIGLAPLLLLDWRMRIKEVACFVGLAGVGIWMSVSGRTASNWLLLGGGILVTALALNAFVLLMHDGMHFTLSKSRQWNWLASVVLGSTFLMSFTAYRVLHTRHHRYLGDSRDPDDYQNYVQWRPLLWFLHFIRLTLGPLLYLALIPILALKHATDAERRMILGEYGFLLAVYSTVFRFVPGELLFFTYVVPLLIVGIFTAVRGFTQHGITDAKDPLLASRTVLPSRLVGFFLLHENYHLEHHLFPEVPSYHLARLHELIWRRLPRAVSSRGYLRFLAGFLRATPGMDETPIGLENRSKEPA